MPILSDFVVFLEKSQWGLDWLQWSRKPCQRREEITTPSKRGRTAQYLPSPSRAASFCVSEDFCNALPASPQLNPALSHCGHRPLPQSMAQARLQLVTKLPMNSEEKPFIRKENHFLQLQPEPVASHCSESRCLFSRIGFKFYLSIA